MKNKKWKVGFYFADLTPEYGGAFQYSIYILKLLLQNDRIEKLYLFYSSGSLSSLTEILKNDKVEGVLISKPNRLNAQRIKLSEFFLNRYYHNDKKKRLHLRLYKIFNPLHHFFNKFNLDIFHVPWQMTPVFSIDAAVLVTIHDLQHLHFPEFFDPFEFMHRTLTFLKSVYQPEQVISSFEHVKEDIKKYYKIGEEHLSVCPVPINFECFSNLEYPSFDELKKTYPELQEGFILTPAATWPHKNHLLILKALKILKEKGQKIFWVSTGHKKSFYNIIEKEIKNSGMEDQVFFAGLVSDSDLMGLYKSCRLVVMPTLYEAGSGPLFESFRFGAPVICSNVTSLPESMNQDEFIFDPYDEEALADLILRGISDEDFRKRNIENGRKRLEYYNNIDYITPLNLAYQKALDMKIRL